MLCVFHFVPELDYVIVFALQIVLGLLAVSLVEQLEGMIAGQSNKHCE